MLYTLSVSTLYPQEMDSGALVQDNPLSGDGGAVNLIKKELDERLTEEQRRQVQVGSNVYNPLDVGHMVIMEAGLLPEHYDACFRYLTGRCTCLSA